MPATPDPAAVARLIVQFDGLDDRRYAEALSDTIMSPRPPTQETLEQTSREELVAWARRLGVRPAGTDADVRVQIQAAHAELDEMRAEEVAAFRSDALAVRSFAAAQYLIDNVNTALKQTADESNKAWQLRAERFRNRVGMERRILKDIVTGMYARQGRIDNRPQPRKRAQERLWSLVMRGDTVTKDTLRQLLEDEEAKVEQRKQEEKEKRRAAKRAAKAAGR